MMKRIASRHLLYAQTGKRTQSLYREVPKAKTSFVGTVLKVLGAGFVISSGLTLYSVYKFLETRKYVNFERIEPHLAKRRNFRRDRPDLMYKTLKIDLKNTVNHMKAIREELEPQTSAETKEKYSKDARHELLTILKALVFGTDRDKGKELALEVEKYIFTEAEIAARKKSGKY